MALTFTEVGTRQSTGNKWRRTFDITFDSAYAASGESMVAADVGMTVIESVVAELHLGTTTRSVAFDHDNNKLLAYIPDGTEASGNLSSITVRCIVTGV